MSEKKEKRVKQRIKVMSFYLPEDVYDLLQSRADKDERSMSMTAVRILRDKLEVDLDSDFL